MASSRASPDRSISAYGRKRDFAVTSEPAPGKNSNGGAAPIFVVQKHRAHRAGLHYDFRLEHGGVLWSWAIPKGPSLDPADRRMAIHVEDHPLDYAAYQGPIPDGAYGAGEVETWDHGTWAPLDDPEFGMRKGHLHFELQGTRLSGRFSLVRLKGRKSSGKSDAWFLVKGADETARIGVSAPVLESAPVTGQEPPAQGATRASMPVRQEPQLCASAAEPPDGKDFVSEIKFDGYRMLVAIADGKVRLLTRNGLDWTDRLPALAKAMQRLPLRSAMLDGELVSQQEDGVTSFSDLQAALQNGRISALTFYAFDLLHLDGWDLRPCTLVDRKAALAALLARAGTIPMLRYSDHHLGDAAEMRRQACQRHLEGLIFKKAHSPYRGGRGHSWVKVKCEGREELVVLGWTPPAGSRVGIGALHLGYYDSHGRMHYAGGVGTGFSDAELRRLRSLLDEIPLPARPELEFDGEPIDRKLRWVKPDLVAEIQFTGWTGDGRIRHAVYLGLREDKPACDVIRDVPDQPGKPLPAASPPPAAARRTGGRIVVAQAPKSKNMTVAGVRLSHPDRELWPGGDGPGITKKDLAEYWQSVADAALPGLAQRPLSVLRCPDGITGAERFFQKHGHGVMPDAVREGIAAKQPFLAIDDVSGLVAMAQMSAIELHAWGAPEADPTHPDRLVFDLDPGERVSFADVVAAAHDVRDRLKRLGLESFCRTSGGKGLHVVAPLRTERAGGAASWDQVKPFCRAFAEAMAQDQPDKYVAHVKIADRRGKILVDWLRNGLGATAVASYSPRARPGATVATPLAWREVVDTVDPARFTIRTVPQRLAKLKADPWKGFDRLDQRLPELPPSRTPRAASPPRGKSAIIVAKAPAKRR